MSLTSWTMNTTFKPDEQDALYEPNLFRSSDHDPVLVGLFSAAEAELLYYLPIIHNDPLQP